MTTNASKCTSREASLVTKTDLWEVENSCQLPSHKNCASPFLPSEAPKSWMDHVNHPEGGGDLVVTAQAVEESLGMTLQRFALPVNEVFFHDIGKTCVMVQDGCGSKAQ